MGVWTKFRQFFQPYYVPKPKKPSKRQLKKEEEKQKQLQAEKENQKNQKAETKQDEQNTESVEESKTEPTEESKTVSTEESKTESENIPDEKNESETPSDTGRTMNAAVDTEESKTESKTESDKPMMQKPKALYEPKRSKGRDILLKTRMTRQEAKTSLTNEPLVLMVMNYPAELNHWMESKQKPQVGQIWTHHNERRHQVLAHLAPRTSHAVDKSKRSNERRAELKAWLKPISKRKAYHRTHIIPFGYHGSESDPRLVVGWIATHNEKQLNDFEIKQRNRSHSIYWFVDIRLLDSGRAEWHAEIYDSATLKKVDEITLRTNESFSWRKDGIRYINE